jgi:hypothetical protein
MAFVIKDRARESTTTTGTGAIALAGAVGGYRSFASVMSIGDQTYYAIVLPGGAWETGVGTYSAANTLTRTVILDSSNAGAAVSFVAGTKDIFMCMPASRSPPFQAGTLMLFQQTSAPILWTKQTTHNDKALRVVSGTASSGGTNAFSAMLNSTQTVANTTITVATMPSHSHSTNATLQSSNQSDLTPGSINSANGTATVFANGSDGPHNHTFNLAIQYVDLIICSKDA